MLLVAIKGKTAEPEHWPGSLHRTFPPHIFSKPGEHDLLAEKERHEEVLSFCTVPAFAQSGCDDSPENPTLILAVLAGGGYGANSVRERLRARRPPREL